MVLNLYAGRSLTDGQIDEMLRPRFTAYWQFFVDDNVDSHYFGGVGPEIIGTLLITVVGMLFVIPLGVISAAYLVECASEGWVIRIIRMSINTLAGVPSIVFGLFGLAFFVLFLFPLLNFEPKPCILAASLTLAVLTPRSVVATTWKLGNSLTTRSIIFWKLRGSSEE